MTETKKRSSRIDLLEIVGADQDCCKELWREVFQEVLEQKMTGALRERKRN
jgi:hypothetical protein